MRWGTGPGQPPPETVVVLVGSVAVVVLVVGAVEGVVAGVVVGAVVGFPVGLTVVGAEVGADVAAVVGTVGIGVGLGVGEGACLVQLSVGMSGLPSTKYSVMTPVHCPSTGSSPVVLQTLIPFTVAGLSNALGARLSWIRSMTENQMSGGE